MCVDKYLSSRYRQWSFPAIVVTVTCTPMWGTRAQVLSPDVNQHTDTRPTTLVLVLYSLYGAFQF